MMMLVPRKQQSLALLFLTSLLCTFSASDVWALPVARLRNLKPQVQVRIEGKGAFSSARERATLRFGDIVRTDANGKAEVLFSNGTRVAMREKSQIQIVAPEHKDSPLVIRVFGALSEVFVRPKGNTQVKTAAAIAAARGTAFLVRLPDENSAIVTVTEDEVDFWNEQGRVLIATGEQSTAKVGSAPTPPVAVDVSGLAAWTAEIAGLPVEFETPFQTPNPVAARRLAAQRQAALQTSNNLVQSRLELGRALYDAGEYSASADEFERVVKAQPDLLDGWLGLAAARRGQGDLVAATTASERAVALDNRSTPARVALALTRLASGEFEKARNALSPIEGESQAQAVAGLIALYRGDYADAENSLRAAIAGQANLYQAHSLLALALLSQNKLDEARGVAQRGVQLQSESAQAQGALAMVLFFSGREYSRSAAKAAKYAVELNPLSSFALLVQGRSALAEGDVDQAREAFGQAAALSPHLEITHTELANAYLRQGRIASAEKEYSRALAINSNSAAAQAGLAQALASSGKRVEAQAAFEKAITLNANDSTTRAGYAAFLIEEGRLGDARIQLDKGVVAAPERGILYSRLSEVNLMRQDFKEAEKNALKAVGLLPDSALTHYQLGRVYLELERTVQALQEFRIAVRLDREFAEARYALGYVREWVEMGRDPSRPSAAAGPGALNSASRAVNLQNLQTPGAEDRIQAAIQDPTVVRTASRSYGDTELKAVIGQDGVLDGAVSHLQLSKDRRGVFGLTAQRESYDEVRNRDNSDLTNDRYSIIYGRKAKDNPSSFFLMGDYERLDEGLNRGDQPPTASASRDDARKPRLIVGANWQKDNQSRTRALLQASRAKVGTINPTFGDRQDAGIDSLNAEVRHDRRIGRQHYASAGLFLGERKLNVDLFLAGFPPFFPDQRLRIHNKYQFQGVYLRDEFQVNHKLFLTGEAKVVNFDGRIALQFIEPVPLPVLSTDSSQTKLLPTFIAEYRPSPRTGVRFRARRVYGGIRDFQLLSPTDTFLSPLNDLPTLGVSGNGTSLELEGDHTFKNGSFARIGLFNFKASNILEPTADGSGAVVDRASLRGLRAGYEGVLSKDLSFFLNAGYTQAKDRETGEQIANVPRWTTEAGLQYLNRDGWFVQPSLYYQSSRQRTDGVRANSFGVANLRFGKRFGLHSTVFAELVNLTDKKYDILDVEQPGRQLRLGVIGRF